MNPLIARSRITLGLAVGLLTLATPVLAADGWTTPQSTVAGSLNTPSMVADAHGFRHIVARADTGISYLTDSGTDGSWVQSPLTQDFETTFEGQVYHHWAMYPRVAINGKGTLTVVYATANDGDIGSCGSRGLRYIVRQGGSDQWSQPTRIPDSQCQIAAGIVVHGTKIYLATHETAGNGAGRVGYYTNASGSWTHVTVASGFPTDSPISLPSLVIYDELPMLAYTKQGYLYYARGATSTGDFTREKVAATDVDVSSAPSLAINPKNDRQMIAWAQADGTHYAYRNALGWWSYRVMQGSVRALLAFGPGGDPHIASAGGAGGLWYADRSSGSWLPIRLDTHNVSDLGGLAADYNVRISYLRGASRHLFAVDSYMGC
jgi:hypothetical protein